MPNLTLYTNPGNWRAHKALIAAKYGGIEVHQHAVQIGTDTRTPEFLAKNPLGKVPVLETDEGFIFESNAIARYIARLDEHTHLLGANDYESGLVDQWLDFALSEIELPAKVWLYPIFGLMEVNQAATNKAKGDIRKVLEILNQHLADQTYLVGERVTLADIVVAIHLGTLFQRVLDAGFRKPFANVVRWFTTLINQPNFKEVLGEVTLATKMEQAKPSEHAPKQEAKQEKPKPAPQPAKPKEEKKPKKKEEDDDAEEESEEAQEEKEKPKNPLDLLPKSTFDLETWKRTYSNKDGQESIKWFWENLDKEGWSLWRADYKYNDELGSLLRTCNLIFGWFQRLERLRKYGFGSALIFKNGEKLELSSAWLVRGQELPAEILSCDDTELHAWTKLNPDDPEVRKSIQEYWNWEGDFGGKVFEQGKIYK